MHLLLPPSEQKARGGRGRPLRSRIAAAAAVDTDTDTDDAADAFTSARARAIEALLILAGGDPVEAAAALHLPDGVAAAALHANASVLDAPTMPALRRYTGVVYEGLRYAALAAAEQCLARRCVLIFSGLFGVVRGDEAIPTYRVPATATLPGLGTATSFWRPTLARELPARVPRGLVVDLRSSDYAGMWRPDPGTAERTLVIRVLSPAPRGGYAVISHPSKLAKGRLAAALIRRVVAGGQVADAADVAAAWQACDGAGSEQIDAGRLDIRTT